MSGDPQFNNIPLVASFLKYFNRAYLGSDQLAKDSETKEPSGTPAMEAEESEQLPAGMAELVPVEVQRKMRELFVGYFQNAGKTLVKGQIVRFFPRSDLLIGLPYTRRNFSSRTDVITRRTLNPARSSRTVSTLTSG